MLIEVASVFVTCLAFFITLNQALVRLVIKVLDALVLNVIIGSVSLELCLSEVEQIRFNLVG